MSSVFLILFTILAVSSIAQSTVPSSKTFKYTFREQLANGSLEEEHSGLYTDIQVVRTNSPFALCHYTTFTPVYVLGIRLGIHLVWEANKANPVQLNSTLTFGLTGNLVLARPNGHVVWQTGTANKGVVDIKLHSDGNLVLLDKQGKFVWQSFDYPTDTLMVDQPLRPREFIEQVTLRNSPAVDEPFLSELTLNFKTRNFASLGMWLANPKFDSKFSFLRLGDDGNLKAYSYFTKANMSWNAWEVTYTLFSREYQHPSECHLPEKCGGFGVCEESQCVGCPSPNGPMWWSKTCSSPSKLPTCAGGKTIGAVSYFEIVGVDHFSSEYSRRTMRLIECRDQCSRDCKCKGFFYQKDTSKCLLASQLNTLTKAEGTGTDRVAFIKFAK
ncbi:hypothetical protein GIB67_009055 [Kingdonia uniflora]|uniref:Uncharacterized protein n=1 Tax=Kingdonia uniflora TaxID=39325 RepID=A0A7J7P7F5_9MAGN|nr:hypothetical protein GIB67_009055 [Kingdonia uniflora]